MLRGVLVDGQNTPNDLRSIFFAALVFQFCCVLGHFKSKVEEELVIDTLEIRFLESLFKELEKVRPVFEKYQILFVFKTRQKLDFTKLNRLKPASGHEILAKLQKLHRCHGFQNMNLLNQ